QRLDKAPGIIEHEHVYAHIPYQCSLLKTKAVPDWESPYITHAYTNEWYRGQRFGRSVIEKSLNTCQCTPCCAKSD
ncbi:hypothetical protein G9A89_000367, partial [Geosiphon pyriformis]